MPKFISLKVSEELYELIAREADAQDLGLIDIVVHALARYYGRDDLDYVPRARRGRKRQALAKAK